MKTKAKVVAGLIAAGLMIYATTASADEFLIEGNLGGISTADSSYVGLSGDGSSGGGGILLGYELDAVPGLRVLGLYGTDGVMGDRFANDLRYDWGRNRLMAGADYGIDLFEQRLRPLARLTVGYTHQSLRMEVDNIAYRDRAHGLAAHTSAGVEMSFGRGEVEEESALSRFSMGVNFLVGYLFQSEASFDEMRSMSAPSEPNDEDPWTRGDFDAGSLQMSGTTWNLGAVVRYRFGS